VSRARVSPDDPAPFGPPRLTALVVAAALFIPASGWRADRFGAGLVFQAAILVFTLGRALCGLAAPYPSWWRRGSRKAWAGR
jgi:MFS family permease